MEQANITYEQLLSEIAHLRLQLAEANETIDAIRTGQVDALIVNTGDNNEVYTLKTADQTYRVFIEKMNEGAVTINHEGLVLYSNSKFAGMVNMPLEKVIGLSFETFVPEDSRQKFDEVISQGWQTHCKEEIELRGANETLVPCLLSCNTLDLDKGTALSLILTDLTLLKETENELKVRNEQLAAAHFATEKLNNELEDTVKERTNELFVSREHFKYLANNIPQMTWTNLPDGQANYFNQQWYSYTGMSFDETISKGWEKVVHPDDLQATIAKFAESLKTGQKFEAEARYLRNSDKSYRWHLNRAVPIRDEQGEIAFWVGTATDIEDQKREMAKKDEFIGIASHELKTPLTSLKGYLQLINSFKKEEVPQMVKQYVAKANIAISKLQRLINDLLDVSKIQAGRLEYALTAVDMPALIKACLENAGHIYPEHVFQYEEEDELLVFGNAERIEQVIMNLVSNAVKYSKDNKTIIIESSRHFNCCRVAVTDFGIGLSAEEKERIFERFYRVEDKKHMTSGLGMGLYISAEIIRNHKGEIGVESEFGKGATFYFELPLL